MLTEYPLEIIAIRRDSTLGIEASFKVAKADGGQQRKGEPPLGIYSRASSGLWFAGITPGEGSVKCRVPVSKLAGIFKASDYAYNKHMDSIYAGGSTASSASANTSPAYTVRFTSGNLKGKTPAGIYTADPKSAVETLTNQRKFLKDNLAKYPDNKKQIDAIDDLAKLIKSGKFNASQPSAPVITSSIPIYTGDPHPQTYEGKVRADGKCFTHIMDIKWDVGQKYPVTVTLKNFYAPFIKEENGQLKSKMGEMDPSTLKTFKLSMSPDEWHDAIRAMKAAMHQFEVLNAKKCIEDAASAKASIEASAGIK